MQPKKSKPASAGSSVLSVFILVIDLVGLALLGLLARFTLPRFMKILEEFEVELPVLTQWVLSVPPTWYVGAFAGIGVLLVLKEIVIRNAAFKSGLNLLAGLALLAFAAVAVVALFLPLITLVEALS